MKIRDLQEKRTKLGNDAASIMDEATKAGRSMTNDEEQSFDRLLNERDQVDATIERAQRLEDDEARRIAGQPGDNGGADNDEVSAAWRSYLLGGRPALSERQARALNMGNDPEGGFLVAPEKFVQELLAEVDDAVVIRGLATIHRLTQAESLGVPTRESDLNDAEWTSEIGTGSQDDSLRFGKRELRPHPLAKRVKISRKLLRTSTMGPEAIVRERMAYRHSTAQEKAMMTGDGNQKPLGLFTASSDGISTSRDVSIGASGSLTLDSSTADELIDAKYTLKSQYYRRSRWLLHRDVLKQIRKLKNGDGDYIWKPGLASDRPDMILDVPYILSEFAPNTISGDSYIAMIGDFSRYWIVDALQIELQRLFELYAESNQVGFIGRAEVDGMPTLEEPFVRLQVRSGSR